MSFLSLPIWWDISMDIFAFPGGYSGYIFFKSMRVVHTKNNNCNFFGTISPCRNHLNSHLHFSKQIWWVPASQIPGTFSWNKWPSQMLLPSIYQLKCLVPVLFRNIFLFRHTVSKLLEVIFNTCPTCSARNCAWNVRTGGWRGWRVILHPFL